MLVHSNATVARAQASDKKHNCNTVTRH